MKPSQIVSLVLFGLFLIGFMSSCTTIETGTRGIVTRFGSVQPDVLDEGLHFVAPFVDRVTDFPVRTLKDTVESTAASKDLQEIKAHLAINWHPDVTKVQEMFQKLGDREAIVINVMQPAVNEVFKAASANLSAEEILKKRSELKHGVDQSLIKIVSKYGLIIDEVSIVDINFSEDFNKAIEDKQIAEQNAQKAVYVAQQAKEEAKAEIARAEGKAKSQSLQRATVSSELIRMKAIEVQEKAVEKWDGKLPGMMGAGPIPFLQVENK